LFPQGWQDGSTTTGDLFNPHQQVDFLSDPCTFFRPWRCTRVCTIDLNAALTVWNIAQTIDQPGNAIAPRRMLWQI
jgi:hypothetical protein